MTSPPHPATYLVARLSIVVLWLVFAVFHLALLCLLLLLAWAFHIDSTAVAKPILAAGQFLGLSAMWQILVGLGVSGVALLSAYVWCWKTLYTALVLPYLLKDIEQLINEAQS